MTRVRKNKWLWASIGAVLVLIALLAHFTPHIRALAALTEVRNDTERSSRLAQPVVVWTQEADGEGIPLELGGVRMIWPELAGPAVCERKKGLSILKSESLTLRVLDEHRWPGVSAAAEGEEWYLQVEMYETRILNTKEVLALSRAEADRYRARLMLRSAFQMTVNGVARITTDQVDAIVMLGDGSETTRVHCSVASRTTPLYFGFFLNARTQEEGVVLAKRILSTVSFRDFGWSTREELEAQLGKDVSRIGEHR